MLKAGNVNLPRREVILMKQYRYWLFHIRKAKGKTQKEVADACGIKRQYYGMIENGANPSVDVAKRIAAYLGFDWTLFYEHVGNETLPEKVNSA